MYVFVVSDECKACGQCVLETDLLAEDKDGKAVPVAGKIINESDLDVAEQIAKDCPVGALSVQFKSSVSSKGQAGVLELADVLEKRFAEIRFPEVQDFDLQMNAERYHIDHDYVSSSDYEYTSYEQAQKAGVEKLYSQYMSRFDAMVISILAQYKSDKLSVFMKVNSDNIFSRLEMQIRKVLENIRAEAKSITGNVIDLPYEFTRPKICKDFFEGIPYYNIDHFEEQHNRSGIAKEMREHEYNKKTYYECYVNVDDMERYVQSGPFGGSSFKTRYSYNIWEAVNEYIDRVQTAINWSDIDEKIDYFVSDCLRSFKYYATVAIEERVSMLKSAARKLQNNR